ncbi:MAG: hypothetical protein BWK78_03520, partial [Thiotrichaceae bacterium IS1]
MNVKIFLLLNGIFCSLATYAHNASFDVDSDALHIPAVEVISKGAQTGIFDVQMQRIPDGMGFVFTLGPYSPAKTTLNKIREKGTLRCGGQLDLPGFGFICPDGRPCGFDTDLCKAVAAAVFNSSTAPVELLAVSTSDRKAALTESRVDILSRNTTWTSVREADWGNFTWIMFYDGQGFMVRKDSGIT